MNRYIFLANLVVFFHLLYVGFVVVMVPVIVVGGWRKWSWVRNFWFRLVHFFMIGIVVVETVFSVTCPLTTWESDLRVAGGQLERAEGGDGYSYDPDAPAYQEDFVGRLLRSIPFFDPESVPQWVLNCFYYAFGGLILVTLFLIPPRWPRRKPHSQPALATA